MEPLIESAPEVTFAWQVVCASRRGRKHRAAGQANEDAVQARTLATGHLALAVADGVGGGCRGDQASAAVARHWVQAAQPADAADALVAAHATLAACEQALERALPAAQGRSGSMLVGAWAWPDGQVVFGHVGDCRAYLWREQRLIALTRDHTYANLGLTPPVWRMPDHPARMVGGGMMGPPDVQRLSCLPGDLLVLCSDGLHAALDVARIEACLMQVSSNEACPSVDTARQVRRGRLALARLCRLARTAGSDDDISVALAWFSGEPGGMASGDTLEPRQATLWSDSTWPSEEEAGDALLQPTSTGVMP